MKRWMVASFAAADALYSARSSATASNLHQRKAITARLLARRPENIFIIPDSSKNI